MEERFRVNKELGLTEAASKEAFYGFVAGDIVRVYFHKQGFGPGLFFRLRDGRVIDSGACDHNSDPILYEETMH